MLKRKKNYELGQNRGSELGGEGGKSTIFCLLGSRKKYLSLCSIKKLQDVIQLQGTVANTVVQLRLSSRTIIG